MDKASAYDHWQAEDSRFESWRERSFWECGHQVIVALVLGSALHAVQRNHLITREIWTVQYCQQHLNATRTVLSLSTATALQSMAFYNPAATQGNGA